MPKISIVMPVYNGEKYLREAVNSVIGQCFTDWELILVDDCSNDSSLGIMEEYRSQDHRIRVIHNDTNQKLPKSLNIGFSQAMGKYYTWTSDDNRYKPEALYQMFCYLEDYPDTGLVYTDMDYIDENGERTGSVSTDAENLYYNNCVGACFLYRKETAKTVGDYDANKFLVEDYDYWLRIARRYKIAHLPVCLYEYRYHGTSLTETKAEQIESQLYKLKMQNLDFLLNRVGNKEKESLYIDLWMKDPGKAAYLKEKFFVGHELPKSLQWMERKKYMDENKKIILFGAGAFGKKALDYFGADRVAFYADNNIELAGTEVHGKKVIAFDTLKKIHQEYQIVISVDARKVTDLALQLEENGMNDYETYLEIVHCLKKPLDQNSIRWLEVCEKACSWIENYSIKGGGIANNSNLLESYPEVTGYFIPTLMRWGFCDRALNYAKWLCSIQREDGAWYDTAGQDPYVFDTAQILKGLLAVRNRWKGVDKAIKKGCDWILSNIEENGRLTTPSKTEWGEEGVCSELIHLYCLSPLMEAADIYGEEKYRTAAKKTAEYYINHHQREIRDFGFLSHFYAYVMEALCDIGHSDLAGEAMKQMERFLDEKGYVPAYKDVDWVCSTGMFQLAIVWYKLGNLSYGNRALSYAVKLQNESGGWYGSYPTTDHPKAADRKAYPDYFATSEISWAVKYFLDAVYFRNRLEFENQASTFQDTIAESDGRYQIVLQEVKSQEAKMICDVGCGKGRYLKNLLKDVPSAKYHAVDVSEQVMENIDPAVEKCQGLLTQIPYEDETFDLVYTAEALEHSIFPENAMRELLRVTKKGGEVIVIDKNKSAMGFLEIDEWEQWFDDEAFGMIAKKMGCELKTVGNVEYEDGRTDGLFGAWILIK